MCYTRLVIPAFFIIIMTFATNGFQSYPFATAQLQDATTPSDTVDPSCINKMTNEMHSKALTLDNAKAVSMATSQSEFKSKTQGFALNYRSIFNTWKLDTTNCTVQWNDVNVGYHLYNGTDYVKTVVVTLDPALTKVTKVDEQVDAFYSLTTTSNGIWSGYDLAGTTSLPTVLSSFVTSYKLPSVSQPTFVTNPCRSDLGPTFQPCDTAIWTGLEDTIGATNGHLVQAGSDGKIDCTISGCTTSYFLWYEFYPNSAFTCNNSLMAPNDNINLNVTNDQKGGGSNTNYDLSLQDTTANFGCTVTRGSYTAMTTPIYAPFILERAQEDPRMKGYPATLAVFTTNTGAPQITGAEMYYNGAYNSISSSTSGTQWTMSNQGTSNINLGAISSGSFTETWQASDGTKGTCVPPRTGDLIVSASCTVPNNAVAQGNVEVQSGSNVLTIPSGVKLTIHFATNHLRVDTSTGLAGVLIKAGGTISSR